ncbi:MAG: hypothetical protein CL908_07095 [Deltaproteobacteria bacterium]|nr:hypothetical protein [Deltaproteobacteria bacterium]
MEAQANGDVCFIVVHREGRCAERSFVDQIGDCVERHLGAGGEVGKHRRVDPQIRFQADHLSADLGHDLLVGGVGVEDDHRRRHGGHEVDLLDHEVLVGPTVRVLDTIGGLHEDFDRMHELGSMDTGDRGPGSDLDGRGLDRVAKPARGRELDVVEDTVSTARAFEGLGTDLEALELASEQGVEPRGRNLELDEVVVGRLCGCEGRQQEHNEREAGGDAQCAIGPEDTTIHDSILPRGRA